ncbi:MAG: hypothetical protein ACOCV2_14765 [Persicimonas sp.]
MNWNEFLTGLAPREDLPEAFGAESLEVEQPALLNKMSLLTTASVAARLLEVVAFRGGTRLKPSNIERLRRVVEKALPESAVNLCEDEAARVLRWLTEARPYKGEQPPQAGGQEDPEVDIVFEADIASRVSVAEFAIEEGYDLELEYLDAEQDIWPRVRCTPISIGPADDEPADDDESSDEPEVPVLQVESDYGELTIPLDHVRWLMPVSSHEHRRSLEETGSPGGDVLDFPTDRGD